MNPSLDGILLFAGPREGGKVGGVRPVDRTPPGHQPPADGPGQQARDTALAESDPLVSNGWIYGHDAEEVSLS
jgi:hypothetical protein